MEVDGMLSGQPSGRRRRGSRRAARIVVPLAIPVALGLTLGIVLAVSLDSPARSCQNMINIQGPFLAANQAVFTGQPTPVKDAGEDLFTFLANRLIMSFDNLGRQGFGLRNPVTVVLDGAGAAISATLNTTPQQATLVGANGGGT